MKFLSFFVLIASSMLAFAQPTASFTLSDNVICEGDCIDIENTSSNDVDHQVGHFLVEHHLFTAV